jgi:DNA-binding MarR family transcriptional regulator
LIEREVDEGDARRTFVRLSPRGCELMEDYLTG